MAVKTDRISPIKFFGSQLGADTTQPLSSTGAPFALLRHDILTFFEYSRYLPNIILPLWPFGSGPLDEQYPSRENLCIIFLHLVAVVLQLAFIVSLFVLFYLPFPIYALWFFVFIAFNQFYCRLLNGYIPPGGLHSTKNEHSDCHKDETWVFLNGVSVGQHWLQASIDRISRTFHRPVTGIHNKTAGIIFDVLQCLIQRCFRYYTSDVRDCYVLIKKALYEPGVNKVIFIAHSQGGIESSMIIDWLLEEVPQNLMGKLEVYTFGNAANHFNNPYRDEGSSILASTPTSPASPAAQRNIKTAIAHIEHYANSHDFVARWGVLNYVTKDAPRGNFESRFMGRVFERPGSGHQFNQHYLDNMFPLDETLQFAREIRPGDFMDTDVEMVNHSLKREDGEQSMVATRQRPDTTPSMIMPEGRWTSDEFSSIDDAAFQRRGTSFRSGNGGTTIAGVLERDEVLVLNTDPWSFHAKTTLSEEMILKRSSARPPPTSSNNRVLCNADDGQHLPATTVPLKVKDLSRLWMYRNGHSPHPSPDTQS